MTKRFTTRPTRRLLAVAGLAALMIAGCQGPSSSEQTGVRGTHHVAAATGSHATSAAEAAWRARA